MEELAFAVSDCPLPTILPPHEGMLHLPHSLDVAPLEGFAEEQLFDWSAGSQQLLLFNWKNVLSSGEPSTVLAFSLTLAVSTPLYIKNKMFLLIISNNKKQAKQVWGYIWNLEPIGVIYIPVLVRCKNQLRGSPLCNLQAQPNCPEKFYWLNCLACSIVPIQIPVVCQYCCGL